MTRMDFEMPKIKSGRQDMFWYNVDYGTLWRSFLWFHEFQIFFSSTRSSVVKWSRGGYLEKQHKYKLVLGCVTIWWVVLLRGQRKACCDHNINQEPNAGGDSWQLCKGLFRRLTNGHNLVFLRLLLSRIICNWIFTSARVKDEQIHKIHHQHHLHDWKLLC